MCLPCVLMEVREQFVHVHSLKLPHEGCKDQTLGPSWQHLAIWIPGLFVNHPPHNILLLTSFFRIHSLKSKKTPSERLNWETFYALPPVGFL